MIRIGFSTSEAAVSKAIRAATHARVSHAFLTYPDPELGIDVVMEAWWDGLIIRPLKLVRQTSEVVALVDPIIPLDVGLRFLAKNYLGLPYDYAGLVGFPYVLLCRACGRHPSNPLHNAKAVFCSEAVTIALHESGYPGVSALMPECTSPQDLFEFLAADHRLERSVGGVALRPATTRIHLLRRDDNPAA